MVAPARRSYPCLTARSGRTFFFYIYECLYAPLHDLPRVAASVLYIRRKVPDIMAEEQSVPARLLSYVRYQPSMPQEDIPDGERTRSIRRSFITAMFSKTFMTGIQGAAIVGLFVALGATPRWIGLLSGAGHLGKTFQPLGSFILSRSASRKRTFLLMGYVGRLVWWPIIAVALFVPPGTAAVISLFFLVLISRLSDALGYPAWYSWMTDLAPEDRRGYFWGTRQMVGGITGIISALVLNYFLGDAPTMYRFAVFFGIVAFIGWLDIFLHRGIVGVKVPQPAERPSLAGIVSTPLRDRIFLPILVFSVVYAVSCSLGGGIFHLMLLTEVDLSYFEVAIYVSGVQGVANILAAKVWGRIIDNVNEGDRLVFFTTSLIMSLVPALWPFTPARAHGFIALNLVLSGIGWSGWYIALASLLASYSPQERRADYVAVFMVTTALGNMIGASVGGYLAEAFAGVTLSLGPFALTPIRAVYVISALGRMGSLALLPFIRRAESRTVRSYVRQVFTLNPLDRASYQFVWTRLSGPNSKDMNDRKSDRGPNRK